MGLIKEDDKGNVIAVYDSAPGLSPTFMKPEDLIVITSSKKEDIPASSKKGDKS